VKGAEAMNDKNSLWGVHSEDSLKPKQLKEDVVLEDADAVQFGKCVIVYPKGAKAITIERNNKATVSFQYMHITHMSEYAADGKSFWFIFGGEVKHLVVVHGSRLRDAYARIDDHCVRIIREFHRDIDPDDGKPFISKIEVTKIEEEKES
jgi:hypothetical protein